MSERCVAVQVRSDIDLIWQNCIDFNGADHQFSKHGLTLRDFATDDRRGADGQHESPATHEAFAAWMFERYESLRSEARPPPSPP